MITNEELKAVYARPEIKKIVNSAAKKFKFLDKDELESCKLIGLWKALESNNDDVLLTTNIYNNVMWQCKDRIKLLYRNPNTSKISNEAVSGESSLVDLIDDISSIHDGNLVIEKIIDNLSLCEMGAKRNVSTETIRIRINKAIKALISRE
jgi:hypothetical protein